MSQRDPGVYLEDIEHYAGLAISFTTALSLEQYLTDAKTRAAVERVLEVCGEALNQLYRIAPTVASEDPACPGYHRVSQHPRAWLCGVGPHQGL